MAILMHAHVAIFLKLSPHYVMVESTLRFNDVGVVPGLHLLFHVV